MSIYKGVDVGQINLDNLRRVNVVTEKRIEIWVINMTGVLLEIL